jgi:hypothetical protein
MEKYCFMSGVSTMFLSPFILTKIDIFCFKSLSLYNIPKINPAMKSNKLVRYFLTLIAAALATSASGQSTREENAAKEIERIMENTNATGLSVAVVKDGKIIVL